MYTYVKWPNSQVREFVHEGFKTIGGIEDIIGSIDGIHFILQNAPTKDKEVYFTRKKRYALHCQGIVDHRGNDFLIGDSAYPLSPFLIKPYNKPNSEQKIFNQIFSSHRIVVEHSFELLGDIWNDEDDDNFNDDDNDDYSNDYNEEELKRAGESKRDWIMRKLFTSS
ncbi:hypothetical protein RhiirA4_430692 [Rhizophagus irregularis]|uniref:DDE Tnp4 domain-containing protein n=1 Tax=Rhizophagus irregularis TaxID=588596 RepID=A0A2I1HLP6_9GLOM|nr:hypothetical protein RhiirA4_430692 [Rhizophagus irregularis]